MECKECYQSEEVKRLFDRVEKLEERFNEKQEEHGRRIGSIETTLAANSKDFEWMKESITEIKDIMKTIATKLDTLEKEPGNNWKEVVKTLITAGVALLVGYFAMKAGIK